MRKAKVIIIIMIIIIIITIIIIVTIIQIMTQKIDWQIGKQWNCYLNKKLVSYICQNDVFHWKLQVLHKKQFKTTAREKKDKKQWDI